ncbi:MAG: GAF domain-containing sensor histidine kinase, partial [Chloroflexota bacterium]|nr:GAF domain-containing sensor histidine kinase [Chloroflexota bacterium]
VLSVVRDVTGRMHDYFWLEQSIKARTHELSTLLRISQNIVARKAVESVLDLILEEMVAVIDYDAAAIVLLEGETGKQTERQRGSGLPAPATAVQQSAIWDRLRGGEAVLIPSLELAAEEVSKALSNGSAAARSACWMLVPIMSQDALLGYIVFFADQPNRFRPRQTELAQTIANQAAVAIENTRLYEQARHLAALQERQRLSRELHDSVSQALYGIALGTQTARAQIGRSPEAALEPLNYVLSLAEAGMAEMRSLIFDLRPEALEADGLVAALERQATSLRVRHDIEVVAFLQPEPDIPLSVKEALYLIAREAMHNVVRHANATCVHLSLTYDAEQIVLAVQDNGTGFDVAVRSTTHLGLQSMRERVAKLGGQLEIRAAPGAGTSITACVPLERYAAVGV